MNISLPSKVSFEDTSVAFSSKSDFELKKAHWLFFFMNKPWMVKTGTSCIQWAFRFRLPVKWIIKKTVFSHFCGGESITDCEKTIQNLAVFNIGTILDYSVEGEKNEKSFDATAREIIQTIEKAAQNPKQIPFSVFKVTGITSFSLLSKIQNHEPLSEEEQEAWKRARKRVDHICRKAYEYKVRIFIDAEESWIQKIIDTLAYEMMESYNTEEPIIYNTYQLYCKASLQNLKTALKNAQKGNYYLGAKLVRGAYMEKERDRAEEKGYESPIQADKQASDQAFDQALVFCMENYEKLAFCAGTHNERSSLYLVDLMTKNAIPPSHPHVYFAQLYGMSDHISYNLANAGYNVAKYVPYGPLGAVMPYLIRRAKENTSVAGQSSREFTLLQKEVQRRSKLKK